MIDLLRIISELLVYSLATVLGSVLCLLHFKSLNVITQLKRDSVSLSFHMLLHIDTGPSGLY